MKIKFSAFCWKCFNETDQSPESYKKLENELKDRDFSVEVNEENIYEYICPKGHSSYSQLQAEKFEILFDLGTLALIDGYSKESISTIASSFERFIEYCIKVICISKKVLTEEFLKSWKTMIKQSERQVGAFYILQLITFGETRYILNDKMINLRNRIIHQGYIPKSTEAIEYGEYILSTIFSLLKDLNSYSAESIEKANILRISENGSRLGKDVSISTSSVPTIISLRSINDTKSFGQISFSNAINAVKENGFYRHFYDKNL